MLFVSYAQPLSVAAHTAFFKKREEGLLKSLILKEGWYPKRSKRRDTKSFAYFSYLFEAFRKKDTSTYLFLVVVWYSFQVKTKEESLLKSLILKEKKREVCEARDNGFAQDTKLRIRVIIFSFVCEAFSVLCAAIISCIPC